VGLPGARKILLLRREHVAAEPAVVAGLESRGCRIVEVEKLTEGTACTILLARTHIDNDRPLLIANSDQLADFSCHDFVQDCLDRDLDGSILVFKDPARNPKWSFARLDEQGLVVEVAEKKPISDLATVGIYFFRRGADFVRAAADMIAHADRVNGEFYTCPVYNYAIRNGLRIGVYEIAPDAMHGLGTPEDLEGYLARHRGVAA
jgi:dTDP-glucose pyrophosphorylase